MFARLLVYSVLTADNFTCQGRASTWERVNHNKIEKYIHKSLSRLKLLTSVHKVEHWSALLAWKVNNIYHISYTICWIIKCLCCFLNAKQCCWNDEQHWWSKNFVQPYDTVVALLHWRAPFFIHQSYNNFNYLAIFGSATWLHNWATGQ